jgi:hypothetical protein
MRMSPANHQSVSHDTPAASSLPLLLTIDEAADLLRTAGVRSTR